MTYLTDELRGIDAALSDLRQRVASLEAALADLKKSIPVRYATERQKSFIHDICTTLNIPYPEGFPNHISFTDASKFIDEKAKFFYDAKRAKNGNGGRKVMSFSESIIAIHRTMCPLCRGEGYVFRGATVVRCPECERRDWEEFHMGHQDLPPCFGYASCAPKAMRRCPWREGCREGVLR